MICIPTSLRLLALLGLATFAPLVAETVLDASPTASPYVWKNVVITGGGFVSGIVPHPAEAGLIYVRTDVGGAYRWEPSTRRWQPITDWIDQDDWTLTGIESIGLDPTDPDRVYLAAGSYTNDWSGNGAILRSADRGLTWERTPMPLKFGGNEDGRSNGERLAVDPAAPSVLFLGSRHDGLWRSADHGATWSRIDSFVTPGDAKNVGITAIVFSPRADAAVLTASAASSAVAVPAPTRILYAATSSPTRPLWRSDDAGATWSLVPDQPLGLRPHHVKFGPDGFLYVTYGNEAGPNGLTDGAVWKHDPSAQSWTDITPLKPSEGDRFGYAGLGLDARRPGVLIVSTLCRWAKHDEIFRSTDGGASWKRLTPTATHDEAGVHFLRWGRSQVDLGHWIGDIEIDPHNSDHALYVTGMTIWATDNLTASDNNQPTAWNVRAHGVEETVINEVISPAEGAPLLSVMWDIDGFRHESLDASPPAGFFQPSHGRNTGLDVAGLRPDFAARVHGKGGAFSANNGRTWNAFASLPAGKAGDGRIAVSAEGGSLVWSPERASTWFSRDRGATWKQSAGLPDGLRPTADRVTEGRYYAYHAREGRVYVSSDHGETFRAGAEVKVRDGLLRTVPGHAGHLWLVGRDGLFRSTDSGESFRLISFAATGTQLGFGRAAADADYPALYVAGRVAGIKGVFRSVDAAQTWTRINTDSLGFHSISTITGDPRVFGRVYIGTRGRGIFYGEPAP